MEVTDIILGGALLYGLGRGLWKGFFAELASLISLIVGVFIAIKFSGYLADILSGHVSWQPRYISIVAFALTFIAVVIGIALLAKTFTKIADATGLGFLNRVMGGVFGFLKMLLIVSILLNFFLKLNYNYNFATKETLNKSVLFYPVLKVSGIIFPVLEEWFDEFKEQQQFFPDKEDENPTPEDSDTEPGYNNSETPDGLNQRA